MRVGLVFAVLMAGLMPRPAPASCAAPQWEPDATAVAAGADIEISGEFFIEGCNDVGGGGVCSPAPREPEVPMRNVRFELHRDGQSVAGVSASADGNGRLAATLVVPPQAQGRYELVATYFGRRQESVPVRVRTAD